jgi:hypothetical protein
MITQDVGAERAGDDLRRVLAVIAEHEEQATEIAAQFAKQGEVVETVWYPDSRRLLAETGTPRFEAVILFSLIDEATTDADEAAVRSAFAGTPLYRVA